MLSLRTVLLVSTMLSAAAALGSQKPPKPDPKKPAPVKKEAPAPRLEPFVGKLAEAKLRAKERNVPILVHLILEGEDANDQYRTKLLPDKDLILASQPLIVIVANNGTHPKKTVEEPQPDGTSVKRELCSLYGTPSCGAHQVFWDDLFREFHEEDGSLRCPQTILYLPDGTVHLRVNNGNPPVVDELVGAIEEARGKAGPGLSEAQLTQVKRLTDEASALMDSKSWPEALRSWQALLALTPKGSWAEAARVAMPQAEKGLAGEVERLSALLVPGQAGPAYGSLQALLKACAGLPQEKDIAARLKKAESDKLVGPEISAWKVGLEADALLGEAQKFADAGDEKKARSAARKLFAKRYDATTAAKRARTLWPDVAAEEDAKRAK